jgi:hypothetical protein
MTEGDGDDADERPVQQWPHKRRLERLETGLAAVQARFSAVEALRRDVISAVGEELAPLALRLDQIEAERDDQLVAVAVPGLTPQLDELISMRVSVCVDGRLGEIAPGPALPHSVGNGRLYSEGIEGRLDMIERALGEVAQRLGALEALRGGLQELGALIAMALNRLSQSR